MTEEMYYQNLFDAIRSSNLVKSKLNSSVELYGELLTEDGCILINLDEKSIFIEVLTKSAYDTFIIHFGVIADTAEISDMSD